MVSSKEFSEKLHFFLRESIELMKIKDINEAMIFLNRYFKHTFSSENLNLWVPDGATGVFFTVNSGRQELRCLATRGLLNDVLKYGKPYNSKE